MLVISHPYVRVDYGNNGDPTDSLSRYQIAMEMQCHKHTPTTDAEQSQHYYSEAKTLWKDVMTRHGREAEYWMEYAHMERSVAIIQCVKEHCVNFY